MLGQSAFLFWCHNGCHDFLPGIPGQTEVTKFCFVPAKTNADRIAQLYKQIGQTETPQVIVALRVALRGTGAQEPSEEMRREENQESSASSGGRARCPAKQAAQAHQEAQSEADTERGHGAQHNPPPDSRCGRGRHQRTRKPDALQTTSGSHGGQAKDDRAASSRTDSSPTPPTLSQTGKRRRVKNCDVEPTSMRKQWLFCHSVNAQVPFEMVVNSVPPGTND